MIIVRSVVARLLAVLLLATAAIAPAAGQSAGGPDTVVVRSGAAVLRGLLWRPDGRGPFPAVLFNHGSYLSTDSLTHVGVLGPVFAHHGYVFLFLYRRGVGLSADQGTPGGDLMARAFAAQGQEGRNRVQLELLETELRDAMAGLAVLEARPEVDAHRVAVAGHSFGASLTVFLAARDPTLRAALVFSGAGYSWDLSPELRNRLLEAARRITAPTLFIHAANDYSVVPGQALAVEMQRHGRQGRLRVYPAVGQTQRDGHNFVFQNVAVWEPDVFAFLDDHLR